MMKQKQRTILNRVAVLVAVLVLGACANNPPRTGAVGEEIGQSLADSQAQNAALETVRAQPPAAVSAALLPPLNVQLSGLGQEPVQRRFDITVDRVLARTFFMSLVKDTPYNMVTPPDMEGRISLSLKNVTLDEVMATVHEVYGYEYRRNAGGYEILTTALRSKIFKVDYLNVQRKGRSRVRVSSGQVSAAGNRNNRSSGAGSSGASSSNAGQRQIEAVSGSEMDTRTQSDFWAELRDALEAIVGSEGGRKIVLNAHSGIIVVRARPGELRAVEQYLQDTQAVVQRQVILEAKILEVELKDGFQSGINWAAMGSNGTDGIAGGQFGGGRIFSDGRSNLAGLSDVLNPSNPDAIGAAVASAFGGVFGMRLTSGNFTAFLEFLESQGDVHVLSSPRVSTVNNQKAVIKVGTDEFFVTDVNTNSQLYAGSSTSNQTFNVEFTPFFSGVALDVTPQIDDDGFVTLHIHPSVSDVQEKIKQIDFSDTDSLRVPMAVSTIRESDSIVRARSGQVVVIGGLMQNISRDNTASVPLLGDLPLVGRLFRHQQKSVVKSELVILLRPLVVDNGQVWDDELQRIGERFGELDTLTRLNVQSGDGER
ncbi:MAG TPA: pilus (MSHA type) biogenesis protein MshL [Gammaproteobacteria bacterium]|nr:pilus (MSHA type) biogenesis protein MshL [Gammaproteobacteria bacterium]